MCGRLFVPRKPQSWVRRTAGIVATALTRGGRLLVLLLVFAPLMATAHLALHFNFRRAEWLSWLRYGALWTVHLQHVAGGAL